MSQNRLPKVFINWSNIIGVDSCWNWQVELYWTWCVLWLLQLTGTALFSTFPFCLHASRLAEVDGLRSQDQSVSHEHWSWQLSWRIPSAVGNSTDIGPRPPAVLNSGHSQVIARMVTHRLTDDFTQYHTASTSRLGELYFLAKHLLSNLLKSFNNAVNLGGCCK